jgi:hypothetical protein
VAGRFCDANLSGHHMAVMVAGENRGLWCGEVGGQGQHHDCRNGHVPLDGSRGD